MHPVSVWSVYMHVGVCCRGVYNDSEMCTVVIMQFRIHIWDFRCFSAVTDVSVDYLTSFYNKFHKSLSNIHLVFVVMSRSESVCH